MDSTSSSIRHPPASPEHSLSGPSLPNGVVRPPVNHDPTAISTGDEGSRGGYSADFVHPLDDKDRCPICLMALLDPVQTECGHRFCRGCIEPIINSRRSLCPLDKEHLGTIYPDNFCKREVLALDVYCDNKRVGCQWIGQLKDLTGHLRNCQHSVVPCQHAVRGCKIGVLRRNLEQHLLKECEYRDAKCSNCDTTLALNELTGHIQDSCPQVEINCPASCGHRVRRLEAAFHLKHECDKSQRICPYKQRGCQFKGNRKEVDSHLSQDYQRHLLLVNAQQSELETKLHQAVHLIETLSETVSTIQSENQSLKARCKSLEEQQVVHDAALRTLPDCINRLAAAESELKRLAERQYSEYMNVGAQGKSSTDEAMQTATQAQACAMTAQTKSDSTLAHCLSLESKVEALSQTIGRSDAIMAEFDLRLLSQETTSFNATLIWKIPDFTRHQDEARSGRKPSIYSPPFYTSRHGYKMCARVYLNGDGVGKDTHMSVFFVVMKGEFDALLSWPFHQKVTLTLLDQSPSKRHISDTFLPDPSSSSFKRPTSEMNIASGCPRFVSLDILRTSYGYVKDNTLFVRVAVDASDLPNY